MFLNFLTATAEQPSFLSGGISIVVAAALAIIALKLFKGIAKTLFYIIIIAAVFLLVTGVIDFALIESAGYSIWDWILQTDIYQQATDSANQFKDGFMDGIKGSVF
ncbi:MAG: hypothetical protein LBL82_02270 [Oscillospiraceae bacterium]|jgi:hypothetical protein|nr:hypothetical protein [Oscillospiraceae bacterium]